MWSSLVKIQYTELKLSCGNDPVVKNYIYSNSDLDLWPNDPKINRVLPLPQGNHVVKFVEDPIYRTSYRAETTLLSKILFIVSDLHLWPNDPKISRVLPLPQGNHVTKFGKDPIYRTKVIVRKPEWTTAATPNHIIRPVSRRAYKNKKFHLKYQYHMVPCSIPVSYGSMLNTSFT
jgi:hypothetical protein